MVNHVKRLKKFYLRLPKELRFFAGPLFGGFFGLLGGLAGFFIGLLFGFLIRELLKQYGSNSEIRSYFKNPGASGFYEGEPGLAAFCGLGILISSKSPSCTDNGEMAVNETARMAKICFSTGADDPALIESFCRIAWLERKYLNQDLLCESLMARRKKLHNDTESDLSHLGAALYSLAGCAQMRDFAREIRTRLDPGYRQASEQDDLPDMPNPWKILDISPQTPFPEIKAHYRRLAAQFHPDGFSELDEEHRETAARAFITIKEAYNQIMEKAGACIE